MAPPSSIPLPPTSCQVTDAAFCRLETHIFKSPHLRIAGAGRERCRPDFMVARKSYPCFTLEFVASGKGDVRLGKHSSHLLPGHIFLYGPGIPLVMHTDPQAPMLKYYIEFFGSCLTKLFHTGIISPGEIRRVADIDHLADLYEHLISAGKTASAMQQAICSAYLNLILIKTTEAAPDNPAFPIQSLEKLDRCRSLIEKNFQAIPNLRALSEMVHLDPSYISRLFKLFHLPSPHRYIETCRMRHAAKMLLRNNQPVKEVAYAVGYDDPLHFSRNFRRQFGCSPSEFQRLPSS